MSTDFNKYADNYKNEIEKSICFSGQTVDFFTEIKAQLILRLAEKLGGDITKLNVLDVGCGIGQTDSFLVNRFHMLYGIDIASAAVERARTVNPTVDYKVYDGFHLPFNEGTFDIVITICVIHHLRFTQRNNFISEMKRVLKNGGLIMIFEHNPFNYFTRHAVAGCEFDKDALLISKPELKKILYEHLLSIADEGYIIFFPFRGNVFRFVECGLKRLPLGAQYYLITQKSADEY